MVSRSRAAPRRNAVARRVRASPEALSPAELHRRAARLRLVLTDSDGVLTDTGVYYSERGEELKRFSIRDGMGVERLRNAGVETGIVTGERSPRSSAGPRSSGSGTSCWGSRTSSRPAQTLCAEQASDRWMRSASSETT